MLKLHEKEDGSIKFLTKVKSITSLSSVHLAHNPIIQGDNNSVDDRGLYAPGQLWLDRKVNDFE